MADIKGLFTKQNTIKSATSILIVTLFLSNILGVVRDHFLAQKVTTDLLDTYYTAFRIPDLIFNTLILGAVSSAFIPVFSRYISEGNKKEAEKLASAIATVGLTLVVLFVIILYFLMPYLVPLVAPEFSDEKKEITLQLSRLMLISPALFSLSYFFSAIMNSYKRFLVSSLAPLVYNLSIIFAAIFFSDKYSVTAVTWGVVVGALLHMAIQFFPLLSFKLRLRMMFDISFDSVREVGRLMLPRSISLGAMQIMLVSFTAIASGLGGGSVAMYSLADNIQTLPTVVFGTSVASALFPTLAENYSMGKMTHFNNYLEKAITSILFFLVPGTIAIILLRIQIVRLVLGSGHFGWEQTIVTAQTLGFFAIALSFSGLIPLFSRAFYAVRNTKTPSYYAIASVLVSIVAAYVLTPILGVAGLALAFSIGSFLNCVLLYNGLREYLPEFSEFKIVSSLNKILIATVAMGVSIQLIKIAIGTLFDLNLFIEVAAQTGISLAIGAAVYFTVTYFLGFKEYHFSMMQKLFGYFSGGGLNGKR